jgi:hypothetical protein
LPQNYDEFLDKAELPCLIDGCGWHGQWLTLHMNYAHGVRADEFKRAVGFNLTTGVVAKPLAEAMRGRAPQGNMDIAAIGRQVGGKPGGYVSREGVEHRKKAAALGGALSARSCVGCGVSFTPPTPNSGNAKFCTVECRSATYKARNKKPAGTRRRNANGTFA